MAKTVEPSGDGRRQRSADSRKRIVAAMLALVRGGNFSPSAEEVAARADVGLRSVFRHFDNMDSLFSEMNEAMESEILPLVERPFASASWRDNLNELIRRRAEIFERIMPLKLASDIHRQRSPFLQAQMVKLAKQQRQGLRQILPKALRDSGPALEALDLILSVDTWRRLRVEQKLSPQRARAVIEEMVSRYAAG